MKQKREALLVATALLTGAMLAGPAAQAVSALTATPSAQIFYVDGQRVALEAYAVEGRNYVQLAALGELLGISVAYQASDNSVRIATEAAETTVNPEGTVRLPTDGARYVPQAGDVIQCDDGTLYAITDVSRWDKNMFASGPVGSLPEPACDWSSFPEIPLPAPEARHFPLEAGDYLFIRNLHESRRMQYTIQNLAGNHPETSRDGKLEYSSGGAPAVRIRLTIPPEKTAQSFWPWRESELERLFESCPPGTYSMEAWDVYCNGIFQRTEYMIHAL